MYYGDWSIYSGQKNFTPDKIDGSLITHLNFAFMDADANGDLTQQTHRSRLSESNVGYSVGSDNKYAGVLGAMVLLRQKYPNMKIRYFSWRMDKIRRFPKTCSIRQDKKEFRKQCGKVCSLLWI